MVKRLQPQSNKRSVLAITERMFKQEAETLYKLKHPQIPKLPAHFQEQGEFYLVQDFIDGDDLSKTELKIGHQLSEAEAINLLIEILEVLAYVHQQDIIHRDIKPANLMRRKTDGKICLIDFGAVKEIANLSVNPQGQPLTVMVGTHGYMPNEQAVGNPQLSSDIYAVGVMAIQALTGLNPNPQSGELKKNANGELVWEDKVQIDPLFAAVLKRMVRYDFNRRYRSAVEALAAVQATKNNHQNTYPPTSSPPTVVSQPNSGNPANQQPTMSNQSTSTSKQGKTRFWQKPEFKLVEFFVAVVSAVSAILAIPYVQKALEKLPPPPAPPGSEVIENFVPYENFEYGFKIKHPPVGRDKILTIPLLGKLLK